jgi:thymidylate synthase (FAD)
MRLILAPTVELVASTVPRVAAMGRFLGPVAWSAGGTGTDPEHVVEFAGRLCYMSHATGRSSTDAWFANVIESGHFSVLEHASFTFAIRGVSRSLTHELVRHRHLSYSQLSQRYVDQCDPGAGLGFVVPVDMLADHEAFQEWERGSFPNHPPGVWEFISWRRWQESSLESYRERLAFEVGRGTPRKRAHAIARSHLTECAETAIVVTGNARSWLEIRPKRVSTAAEAEIARLFGEYILPILAREMPRVFAPQQGAAS